MSRRLTIITEIISPYRIPAFNALAQLNGIELHVLFLAETDSTVREWPVYKNEIHFSYTVLPSYRKRFGRANFLLNRRVCAALRNFNPEVIVCGGYNYPASWQALFWARRKAVPFILWTESTESDARRNNPLIEGLKRIFIRSCKRFVVPGRASRHYLLSFGVPNERIFTAPNAVDNDLFRRAAEIVRSDRDNWRTRLNLPPRFFLFVGRIVLEKGVFDLLESYRNMKPELRSQVGLVFAGDGPARIELERLASDIMDSIRFPGFVHRESLAGYYVLADVLILPTHSDTWGLTVNEGMACGLPIICTDVAGCVPDLVEDGWNGHVISSRSTHQLTSVLERVARNPEVLPVMGENSAKRILHYTPQLCAEGIAAAVA